MIDHAWQSLLALNRCLHSGRRFTDLDPAESTFELHADAVEGEMFLAAANRLADRRGLALLRVDVQGDPPNTAVGFGLDDEDARKRTVAHFRRIKRIAQLRPPD